MPSYSFNVYETRRYQLTVEAKNALIAKDIAENAGFDEEPDDCYIDEVRLVTTDDPTIADPDLWNEEAEEDD